MILIGHRGCSYSGFNQNTIRAFDKVASEGIPAIEFDVQLCGDGHLVVVHNLDLEEVSNGKGKVSTTDSQVLKSLYAGDPAKGKDRIPFLVDVFEFFASLSPEKRPIIHLELKGDGTGKPVGELLAKYVSSGSLHYSGVLVSSFNWQELVNIRKTSSAIKIALLDGAIKRSVLIEKLGVEAAHFFDRIFAYGNEQYMFPRFDSLEKNMELLENECTDTRETAILIEEIKGCLAGRCYTDELLDIACKMDAVSVNLWYRPVTPEFVKKAHDRGLTVLVFTVNDPLDLQMLARIGVDGVFTDYYSQSASILTQYIDSFP